jgi:hypothetical protein
MNVTDSTDNLRDKRVANLIPFQKGQSGNPGGKNKQIEEMKSLARDNGTKALNRIIELIDCEDPRVCLMAAKEVLDRAFGKVKAEEEDPGGKSKAVTINIVRFSDGAKSTLQLEATSVSDEAVELS